MTTVVEHIQYVLHYPTVAEWKQCHMQESGPYGCTTVVGVRIRGTLENTDSLNKGPF